MMLCGELWTAAHNDAVGWRADHRAIEHRLGGTRLFLHVGDCGALGVELGHGILDAAGGQPLDLLFPSR